MNLEAGTKKFRIHPRVLASAGPAESSGIYIGTPRAGNMIAPPGYLLVSVLAIADLPALPPHAVLGILANTTGKWIPWHARLGELQGLTAGWDGRSAPPPSREAIENANAVLVALEEAPAPPHLDRIIPDVQGGVAFYFFGKTKTAGGAHDRYASLDCKNDGQVTLIEVDRGRRESNAQDVDIDADGTELSIVMARILSFLL